MMLPKKNEVEPSHEDALQSLPLPIPLTPTATLSPCTQPVPDAASIEFLQYGVRLYQASMKGDWSTIEKISKRPGFWITEKITKGGETALHIAAAAKHVELVTKLVSIMSVESLALMNNIGNTALCFAAVSGVVEIAKAMVDKNEKLPNIRGSQGMTPLYMAVLLGHKHMVWYLLDVTDDKQLTDEDRIGLLTSSINTDMFGSVIDQEKRSEPELAIQLAQSLWNEIIKLKEEDISNLMCYPWRFLFVAAKLGKVEFLTTLIRSYPDLIWKVDENRRTIFHIAIMHRQEEIFRLIYEIGAIKDLLATFKDDHGNNMLHLASKLALPHRLNSVSGAALQMQCEILWFKAVKQIVRPEYAESENDDKKTPHALFSEEHEGLRAKGEEWMKKTAESCALVATLIATVVFSAAFQLPGGVENGNVVLAKVPCFVVFAISNAISLFTSIASVLMFLSILTSRYAESDFLISLPLKLMTGLTLLFVSIATMIIAFTSTFFITFHKSLRWIPIPIAGIAFIPVALFAFQQYPLLVDMYRSTYKSHRFLFESRNMKLFDMSSQYDLYPHESTTTLSKHPAIVHPITSSITSISRYNSSHRQTPSQIVAPCASEQSTPKFYSLYDLTPEAAS